MWQHCLRRSSGGSKTETQDGSSAPQCSLAAPYPHARQLHTMMETQDGFTARNAAGRHAPKPTPQLLVQNTTHGTAQHADLPAVQPCDATCEGRVTFWTGHARGATCSAAIIVMALYSYGQHNMQRSFVQCIVQHRAQRSAVSNAQCIPTMHPAMQPPNAPRTTRCTRICGAARRGLPIHIPAHSALSTNQFKHANQLRWSIQYA